MLLECRDLRKVFRDRHGRTPLLDGVDLAVERGETVVIRGRSGAGKSTLIHLLCGLEPPTSGAVLFDGRDLSALSPSKRASLRHEKIGILFQNSNLLGAWTALENVEAALIPAGMPRARRRERARGLLRELGLGERLHHLPSELSAGEEHRVALARALANRPVLLLADEPTGDVDAETAEEVMRLLRESVKVAGASLVVATHGVFPESMADRVLVLSGGKLSPAAARA